MHCDTNCLPIAYNSRPADMAMMRNERCAVYLLDTSKSITLASVDGPVLLLSAGPGVVQEENSKSILRVADGKLYASWEPFRSEEIRLRSVDGTFFAVQVFGHTGHMGQSKTACEHGDGVRSDVGTKLLVENALVCVWAFEVEAGAECHVHRHLRDYFFLNILASDTIALDEQGKPKGPVSRQEAGQLTFVHVHPPYPVHGLVNVGSQRFRQFVVEFKQKWPPSRL